MRQEEDRRDRDLLIEIHTMTKSLNEGFDRHQQQDREDFATVHKRINKLNWYAGVGLGGILVLEFVLTFFKK